METTDGFVPGLCRDCLTQLPAGQDGGVCPKCGSGRVVRHPELATLSLAHIDCDAFYATVEKRDNPKLVDRPVIVGGGRRGVVSTCCYIARRFGVRSAMPMFQARQLCPQAVVIAPDMARYAEVSAQVRAIFLSATPLVEPVSLDEAYLDLAGTETLHARSPAATLADIARRIEREIEITVSVGLSFNKLLAKLASEMDKPRGFGVVGRAEAEAFLAARPVRALPGIGKVMTARLESDGLETVGALQALSPEQMARRYGTLGAHLAELARGRDDRAVTPEREAKGISAETTFENDLADADALRAELWPLCEKLSRRLKRTGLAGGTIVLKLRTAEFRILTRRRKVDPPTQLADDLYRISGKLLDRELSGSGTQNARRNALRKFRLIGVGAADLGPPPEAAADLFASTAPRRAAIEQAIDKVRERFGSTSIGLGRGLTRKTRR